MNKLLEEQYQRNIKNILETETRIIQACDYITLHYTEKKENIGKIKLVSNKLVDLRELIGIYEFQCNQILLKTEMENDIYKNMFNILGLHLINQCNLFIKLFDDKLFYNKDYKISQQIIHNLQNFMDAIYKGNRIHKKESYFDNKYKLSINPSINGKEIYLKSDLFVDSYLVTYDEDLEKNDLNFILSFIKDMSILYNEDKIVIELEYGKENWDTMEEYKIEVLKEIMLNKKYQLESKLGI